MKVRWEFKRAPFWDPEYITARSWREGDPEFVALVERQVDEFERLLAGGWEPISAAPDTHGYGDRALVWLRRRAQ